MHSAQRNLQNEWSSNIVAHENKVDFPNYWCSDLQYITNNVSHHSIMAIVEKFG